LIARTSALFFIASSIHDESRKPLKTLRTIPNEGFFPETQRFSQQLQNDCVALSGKKFFFITRGIIISIAGTVLTYELVLLQFGGDEIISDLFNPCPQPQYVNITDASSQT
jgi:gustatory receptor